MRVPKFQFSPERFCEALERSEKTRAEIAREEGCSYELLTFYCLGYRQPPPHRLVSLAQILDVPVELFFVEVDDAAAPMPVHPPSDWRKRYPNASAKAGRQ
jgi:transcriptional regulator with XRE-family HTH domain